MRDEDSIDSADYDDDDTVQLKVQFSLEGVVAGAKVIDVSFPLPGTKVEQDTDTDKDWSEVAEGWFQEEGGEGAVWDGDIKCISLD